MAKPDCRACVPRSRGMISPCPLAVPWPFLPAVIGCLSMRTWHVVQGVCGIWVACDRGWHGTDASCSDTAHHGGRRCAAPSCCRRQRRPTPAGWSVPALGLAVDDECTGTRAQVAQAEAADQALEGARPVTGAVDRHVLETHIQAAVTAHRAEQGLADTGSVLVRLDGGRGPRASDRRWQVDTLPADAPVPVRAVTCRRWPGEPIHPGILSRSLPARACSWRFSGSTGSSSARR